MVSPKKLYRLLREHPDVSTPEGRSRDRYRRAALTSATMFCSRFLNVAVSFATIPIISEYLGGDLFGIWMILTNFISVLIFADLGIGIGFQNYLIKCYAENDREMPSVWVSNALVVMVSLCVILISFAIWGVPHLPLDQWIKCKDPNAASWLVPSAQALAISFAIGLPAMLFQYIGNAYQRGYWPQLLWMCGRFIGLIGTVTAALLHQPLPVLIVIYVAPPYLLELLGLFVLWKLREVFRPSWNGICGKRIRSLFCIGGGFLVTRISYSVLNQGPAVLVAWAFSATEAGYVAVAMKAFQVCSLITAPLAASIYPALGEAVHKNDWQWVARVLRQFFLLLLGSYVSIIALVVFLGNPFLSFLLRHPVDLPMNIFLALSLLVLCEAFRGVPVSVLNAVSHLRYQVVYRTVFTVVPFITAWYTCRYHNPSVAYLLFLFTLTSAVPILIATTIDYYYYKKARLNAVT